LSRETHAFDQGGKGVVQEGACPVELGEEIVNQPEQLAACCAFLAGCPQIGLDTEFVGEHSYHPDLCLVQVATPRRLFLIDPLGAGSLDEFWKLIVDPARLVVVHAGREEVRLCRLWGGQAPGNLFDLQLAAGLAGLGYPLGHGPLVNQVLGIRLSKGETLTEWRRRPLTPEQVRYAFDDVRHLIPAWQKLSARLERLGRLEWAGEEFARLAAQAAPEEPDGERWRKLRGLGSLDRRRLAVVRALYQWREVHAEKTNRPTRQIIRDDLIIEIARRNPSRPRDLQVVRGLPHRDLDAIVRVVQEARALPADEMPALMDRDQDPPQVLLVNSVLMAVLGDLCARMRLTPGLVASTADVKQLVRARHVGEELPADSPLTRGWRAAHVLPELLAVLDGRRAVRVASLRSEAPFAYADDKNEDRTANNSGEGQSPIHEGRGSLS
jgi:ribonuclease D